TQSSGCPATVNSVPRTERPSSLRSTTSPTIWPCSPPWYAGYWLAFRRSAVAGLTNTALSHVSRVSGLGNSWSQPLLEKRPSSTRGSVLNEISRLPAGGWLPPALARGVGATGAPEPTAAAASAVRETFTEGSGGCSTTPLWSQRRHTRSEPSVAAGTFQ